MSDLDDIAAGDHHRSQALRDALTRLANGPNDVLREMATGVLNGDISLRDAVATDTYAAELTKPFEAFWARYEEMTPEEREQLAAQGTAGPAKAPQ
ncbi:hypothetical protein ACN26Y_09080 [Micromonospora sp. WMMD558]|uniref:hypothetical protein n=1 Tax=unclassified Micromonospora TaxID=2617518 RepID=UPI0012B4A3CA|nr:hypothetical protein [Micromonospora sp. WMMC415]QGN46423.1 hypothetical protein GKC29_06000 [Micromonospora sp. WMMC415]